MMGNTGKQQWANQTGGACCTGVTHKPAKPAAACACCSCVGWSCVLCSFTKLGTTYEQYDLSKGGGGSAPKVAAPATGSKPPATTSHTGLYVTLTILGIALIGGGILWVRKHKKSA